MVDIQKSENKSTGWIRLYRSVFNSGWLRNHKLWVFWCYCLLKASHKPHKALIGNQQVELTPGQLIFGRKTASKETGLSEQNIRSCINSLKKLKNLTIKSTNRFSIITIINWTLYQGNNKILTSKVTHDQPAPNQHLTTYKNGDNGNKGTTTPESYKKYLEVLKSISNYPFDVEKDLVFLQEKEKDYPLIDILSLLKGWKAYLLDKPLNGKSRPRAQLHNQFLLAMKWGKYQKQDVKPKSLSVSGQELKYL